MPRTEKRLAKTTLTTSAVEMFNGTGSGSATSVTLKKLQLVNTSTVDARKFTFYYDATSTSDIAWIQTLEPEESLLFPIEELNDIFEGVGEKFYAKQDVGTDVNLLAFGIEVV